MSQNIESEENISAKTKNQKMEVRNRGKTMHSLVLTWCQVEIEARQVTNLNKWESSKAQKGFYALLSRVGFLLWMMDIC